MFIKSISASNLNNLDKKKKSTPFSGCTTPSYSTNLDSLDKKRKFSETTLNNLDNLDKKKKLSASTLDNLDKKKKLV